jgi:glycosyltransferase involved in cell wall biosynthesis
MRSKNRLLRGNRLPAMLRLATARTKAMLREQQRRWGFSPKRPRYTPKGAPLISVVIPAHNEEAYLPRTLEAVRRQSYPRVEVIVVANGCTDRTPQVARHHCDKLVIVSKKALSLARNLGAKLARGELLIFLDADTELSPATLTRVAGLFTRQDAAGTVKGHPGTNHLAYRLMYLYKNFVHCWSLHGGSSGVLICWRDHFLRAGGFDETLHVCENSELIRRLRRFGKYRYIGQAAAITSMRRFEKQGLRRVVLYWAGLWLRTVVGGARHRPYETVR